MPNAGGSSGMAAPAVRTSTKGTTKPDRRGAMRTSRAGRRRTALACCCRRARRGYAREARRWTSIARGGALQTVRPIRGVDSCPAALAAAFARKEMRMPHQLVEGLRRFRRDYFPRFQRALPAPRRGRPAPQHSLPRLRGLPGRPRPAHERSSGGPLRDPQRGQPHSPVRARCRVPRNLGGDRVRDARARREGHRRLRPQPLRRHPGPVRAAAHRRAPHHPVAGAGPARARGRRADGGEPPADRDAVGRRCRSSGS